MRDTAATLNKTENNLVPCRFQNHIMLSSPLQSLYSKTVNHSGFSILKEQNI